MLVTATQPTLLQAFPNPATTALTVLCPASGQLEMRDASGRMVWQGNATSGPSRLPLQGVSGGLYMVSLRSASGFAAVRVSVTKE